MVPTARWLFGPVWTVLYILMGLSLWLVWKNGFEDEEIKGAIYIFLIQLFLNGIWSPLFFGLQNILLGLVDILILWPLILITIWKFHRISKRAGLILISYVLWVSFATILNLTIFLIN